MLFSVVRDKHINTIIPLSNIYIDGKIVTVDCQIQIQDIIKPNLFFMITNDPAAYHAFDYVNLGCSTIKLHFKNCEILKSKKLKFKIEDIFVLFNLPQRIIKGIYRGHDMSFKFIKPEKYFHLKFNKSLKNDIIIETDKQYEHLDFQTRYQLCIQ